MFMCLTHTRESGAVCIPTPAACGGGLVRRRPRAGLRVRPPAGGGAFNEMGRRPRGIHAVEDATRRRHSGYGL